MTDLKKEGKAVEKPKKAKLQKGQSIKKKRVLKQLKEQMGVIYKACEAARISRQTYYRWIADDEKFAQEVQDIQEEVIDKVEHKLYDQIEEGNTTAAIFFLKTRAKHRGYIERQEVEHSGGPVTAIQIVVNEAKNSNNEDIS